MDKPHYPQNGGAPGMYQASDGNWYPVSAMPQGHHQQGGFYGQYGQQQPMAPGPQPVYVQQQSQPDNNTGCWASICAGLCCLNLCCCLC